jgi:heme O synthase-like polyprenyltransferase
MPIVYPPGLTRGMQLVLGIAVVVFNLVVYSILLKRSRGQSSRET